MQPHSSLPTRPGDWLEPAGDSAQLIAHAHQRSAAFGLRPHEQADLTPVDAGALAWSVARNAALCAHARPVMETLSAQIAGTQSMVVLTDASGIVLHALGDDEFMGRAARVALRPGAVWSERSKGTNAVGTALAMGEALQVTGPQHFLHVNQFLACSCAPILDPQGQVMGALDVSGDHRGQSPHTMALVRMSARMVENQLFRKMFEDAVLLRFHAREEFLGTLLEGMAAFAPDGRFLAANRSAQFQLGLPPQALQARTFSSLFGMPMGALLQHARAAVPAPLPLWLHGGVRVSAMVLFRASRPGLVAQSVAPTGDAAQLRPGRQAPSAPPAGAQRLSSLRYLDSGDAQLAQVIDRVGRLLGRDVPTMILGETGTGKELLAQAIHHDGPRAAKPFVAVNCASIPEALMEAELFGYEEGAFTGARRKGSPGKIVQAHGGTLFLDEIGDMPLSMQARLLRVLQERCVAPLGSTRLIEVDVQVICATHRPLRAMMAEGRFRDDLYYRLNGLVVRLPALRERSDLAVIVERLLRAQHEAEGSHGRSAGGPPRVAPEVMALFRAHAWPGNLRQLNNVLRTAALMAEGAGELQLCHLPEDFLDECGAAAMPQPGPGPGAAEGSASPAASPSPALPEGITAGSVREALAAHGGNVSAAARALGVARNTVYRYLKLDQPPAGPAVAAQARGGGPSASMAAHSSSS